MDRSRAAARAAFSVEQGDRHRAEPYPARAVQALGGRYAWPPCSRSSPPLPTRWSTWPRHVIGRPRARPASSLLTMTSGVVGVPGNRADDAVRRLQRLPGHLTLPGDHRRRGHRRRGRRHRSRTRSATTAAVELLERHGSKLHVSPRRLDARTRWFERYGSPVIFFSRLLPVVRSVVPIRGRRGRDAVPALHRRWPRSGRSSGSPGSPCSGARSAATGRAGATTWRYVDYVGAAIRGGRDRLPDRAPLARWTRRAAPDPPPWSRCCAAQLGSARAAVARAGARASGLCTGRRSCCRSPPPAMSRWCRGCWLGLRRARRRAAQVVRGRTPRRNGRGAADHAARRGRRGGAAARRRRL